MYHHLRDGTHVQPFIPTGLKSDVMFIIDNLSNEARRQIGQHSVFADDCAIWMSKASVTTKTAFLIGDDGHVNFAHIIDGKASVKCAKEWFALDPQPPTENLFVLVRSYAKQKDDPTNKRRVSWFESGPSDVHSRNRAFVKYEGQAPSTTGAHHNTKSVQFQYKRTTERVMEQLCSKCQSVVCREGDSSHPIFLGPRTNASALEWLF